jgi:hypothetical protein
MREEEFLREQKVVRKQKEAMDELWRLALQTEQVYNGTSICTLIFTGIQAGKGGEALAGGARGAAESAGRV